jgi:hypothetical protein
MKEKEVVMKVKSQIGLCFIAVTLVIGMLSTARASDNYLDDFNTEYNALYGTAGSRLNTCLLCHTTANGIPSTRNPYGTAFGSNGHSFTAIENLDSDGDTFSNLDEIIAKTFPGNPANRPVANIITITAPNAGEVIPSGSTFTIVYDAPAEVSSVKVRYSLNGGATWLLAVGTPGLPGEDSFDWNVPTPVKNRTKALVKVIGFNASNKKIGSGMSDAPFTIEVVSINEPVADDTVTKGSVYPVTWTTNDTKAPVSSAKVFYTFGSSGIWKPANGTVVDPLGSFSWNVPSPVKTKIVKLKVVLKDALGVTVGNAVSKAFIVE